MSTHETLQSEPDLVLAKSTAEPLRLAHVADLFDRVVHRYADATAAVQSGRAPLTYRQLDELSAQLALRLNAAGCGAGSFVAVGAGRSIDALVAIVAIVRSGAAYVPIDPCLPVSQVRFLLEDVRPGLIIANGAMRTVLEAEFAAGELLAPVWAIEEAGADAAELRETPKQIAVRRDPADPIYVMYTSGSTGRPKGVVVPHRAVARLVVGQDYCTLSETDIVLQLAPLGFDASTFEIWSALLNGGCLAVVASDRPSMDEIGQAIRNHGVTTAWLTAGLFHLMVDSQLDRLAGLHQLLAGGDVLSPDHVRRFLTAAPHCRLINGYGPTENTTFTCCATVSLGDWSSETVPIGRPIAGTRVFIVDERLMPVPAGVVGQLAAAGAGLAAGYLRQPGLTDEKFVDAPYPIAERIYLTGDLVRELPSGEIAFLGRLDRQVKIAGKRVEPGEIEQALRACDGINDAVVIIDQTASGVKRLLAFVAVGNGTSKDAMRALAQSAGNHVRERLAEHLWPAMVVPVGVLPITVNGKIDREALLTQLKAERADASAGHSVRSDLAAGNDWERRMTTLWQDVLGLDDIGLDDSFFDLGGKSLQLMELHAILERSAAAPIKIVDLFARPTVRLQAQLLSQNHGNRAHGGPANDAQSRAERQRLATARRRSSIAG
jgi:amino acid adenylation domain-containing protein